MPSFKVDIKNGDEQIGFYSINYPRITANTAAHVALSDYLEDDPKFEGPEFNIEVKELDFTSFYKATAAVNEEDEIQIEVVFVDKIPNQKKVVKKK